MVEKDEIIDNSGVEKQFNKEQNEWIYNQMAHDYLWNTEIPDSRSLDFTMEPTAFFNRLLSKQDRFSWIGANYDYVTRSSNDDSTVSFDSIYIIDNKHIGYAIYDEFYDNADVRGLAVRMKNGEVNEMVLDLRYNPGGYLETCKDLASFVVPTEHLGKLFQQQRYNDIITEERAKKYNNAGIDSVFLESGSWYAMWGLNLKRLFVLTSEDTASASEALIVGLRPYMEVIVIGTQTCGKDVGSYLIKDNKYKYQLRPITFKYYNALMQSTPVDGIVPDIIVENQDSIKRGNTEEPLLQAALKYIEGQPLIN